MAKIDTNYSILEAILLPATDLVNSTEPQNQATFDNVLGGVTTAGLYLVKDPLSGQSKQVIADTVTGEIIIDNLGSGGATALKIGSFDSADAGDIALFTAQIGVGKYISKTASVQKPLGKNIVGGYTNTTEVWTTLAGANDVTGFVMNFTGQGNSPTPIPTSGKFSFLPKAGLFYTYPPAAILIMILSSMLMLKLMVLGTLSKLISFSADPSIAVTGWLVENALQSLDIKMSYTDQITAAPTEGKTDFYILISDF